GTLDWPKVESLKADVQFSSDSFLAVEGGGDLQSRTLQETIIRTEGAFLTNLLPVSTRYTGMQVEAKVSGPITNLAHAGKIDVRSLVAPQLNPLQIEASWKAQHLTFDDLAVRARAGPSIIFVGGSGYAAGNRTNFIVRQLEL